MQVSIIGSGNVATVLAKQLFSKGHTIKEVYSHTFSNAEALAILVNAKAIDNIADLSTNADIYIIAVSDKAIEAVVSQLKLEDKLLLHTAGSVSKEVLKNASNRYGVLYPVQSIRKNMDAQTPIPFLVDGNDEATIIEIESLARTLNPKVVRGGDEQRVKLHVAAVFACNFVNYMYLQSATYCEAENIDFSLLQSLIEETANRLQFYHPSEVFTGPAVRKDMGTVNKHLSLLEAYPALQEMYGMISEKIMEGKK
jgi:predicted short-subunit dehydrogenase-like oxidoreductase (DUF2520 family)